MQLSDGAGPAVEYAAWVSLDWADQEHAWALLPAGGNKIEQGTVDSTPEAMEQWAQQLAERFAGKPIAVALEQRRGAVVALLSKYAHLVLYPIHPSTLAHYRKSFYPSGAKSDPSDALLQLELLRCHGDRLSVLRPDTIETRKLQFLTEQRRKRVDDRTAYCHELTHWLKQVFPQALRWLGPLDKPLACDFLLRWPTLTDLRRARKRSLQQFLLDHRSRDEKHNQQCLAELHSAVEATTDPALIEAARAAIAGLVRMLQQLRAIIAELDQQIRETAQAHPDFALIASFPGAGEALRPRLLAALGTQRERFASANSLQCYTGIAPVVASSGKQSWVHWRWACPKFLRQTMHEWALHSMKKCEWARQYYQQQRDKQKSHHAAIRALAYKWLRILYRCWKDRVLYNEVAYLQARIARSQPKTQPTTQAVQIQFKSVAGFWKLDAPTA